MKSFNWISIGAVSCFMLLGCVNKTYQSNLNWEDGWRAAKVIAVSTSPEMKAKLPTQCVSSSDIPARYATLHYQRINRIETRIISIPEKIQVHVQDTVFINLTDCSIKV